MNTKFFNVIFVGGGKAETVTVEAVSKREAVDAAEYELLHQHREIVSLADSGLTIQGVEMVNPFSPAAREFVESRDVADYWDLITDLRCGG